MRHALIPHDPRNTQCHSLRILQTHLISPPKLLGQALASLLVFLFFFFPLLTTLSRRPTGTTAIAHCTEATLPRDIRVQLHSMTESSSSDPPNLDRIRSGAISKANGLFRGLPSRSNGSVLPLSNAHLHEKHHQRQQQQSHSQSQKLTAPAARTCNNDGPPPSVSHASSTSNDAGSSNEKKSTKGSLNNATNPGRTNSPLKPPQSEGQGTVINAANGEGQNNTDNNNNGAKKPKKPLLRNVYDTVKVIILHSWINWLLLFVPVGIVVKAIPHVHPGIVFAMNCIAIVPLAGLLSHATETVASKLGDTIGALLNVTFGNAVELIIL
jgi:hypothetical protein